MKRLAPALATCAALSLTALTGAAAPVELRWVTTVLQIGGAHPAIAGETLTTIITVDNGGAGLGNQTWSMSDFVSYRQEGASGWFLESTDIGFASGSFATDVSGAVVSAATWNGNYPGGTVNTSWAGVTNGGWWNNGANETSCASTVFACVWAANVGDNLLASSWTASLAGGSPVPEPATLGLVALALLGAATARRRAA